MNYFAKRLLLAPLTWLAVATLAFLLLHLTPGGPVEAQLADWRAGGWTGGALDTAETRAYLRHAYGFDEPLLPRYGHWLTRLARGDWGTSYRYGRPVREVIFARAWLSVKLSLFALAIAVAIGLPVGAWLASRRRPALREGARLALLALHALPAFTIAIFCLRWLPLWLGPTLTYAASALTGVAFLSQQTFVDEKAQAYVEALRARGLTRLRIARHLLPRVACALFASLPQILSWLVMGSVLVETVFDLPGLGRLSYEASLARDYPVLLASILLLATVQIGSGLLADAALALTDPRLRFEEKAR